MIDRMEEIKRKLDFPGLYDGYDRPDIEWLLGYAEYLEKQMAPAIQGKVFVDYTTNGREIYQVESLKKDAFKPFYTGSAEVLVMPILKREEGNPSCPTSK